LPNTEYKMRVGSKVQKAMHRLYFDPKEGFLVWAIHAAQRLGIWDNGFRFMDLARLGSEAELTSENLSVGAR
jgi:hypothetical protein